MVRRVLFLTALFLAPVSPFVLPINDKKNDEQISIEEISLAGHKNAALVERITKTLRNSFEDSDSEEKNKKSIEVAISVANNRKEDKYEDTDDMKDKSIPGKHNECSDGMIFLSELDICVPWNPTQFRSSVITNIYDIPQGDSPIPYSSPLSVPQTSTHDKDHGCDDGEIYLSELDICAPAAPAKPLPPKTRTTSIYDIMQGDAPAKLTKGEDSSERRVPNMKLSKEDNECEEGEIYLSELDICAPAAPAKPLPPKTRTASIYDIMQGDAPAKLTKSEDSSERRVPNKKPSKEDNECDEGEIYLSELDICAPAAPAKPLPPKTRTASIYDIMQGDAPAKLTKAEDSSERRVPNKKPSKEDNECDEGEIYLSELDICAPHHPAAPLPPKPRSPSIYNIMQGDAPQAAPLQKESELRPRRKKGPKKHKSTKCGKGQLYLSELDICVPYNNCFPYGKTC